MKRMVALLLWALLVAPWRGVAGEGASLEVVPTNATRRSLLPISTDGSCGSAAQRRCPDTSCCSQYNWCGYTDEYCLAGCQTAYGRCISSDGTCGPSVNLFCPRNSCCSQYNWCGYTSDYCGSGCKPAFGRCDLPSPPPPSPPPPQSSSAVNLKLWTDTSIGNFLVVPSNSFNAWSAEGNNSNVGAQVQFSDYPDGFDGNVGALWFLNKVGSAYSFQQTRGTCLDVPGGSTDVGTILTIWTCHGGSNQLWTPIYSSSVDFSVQWQNVNSGLCLDAAGSRNGDYLVQWYCKSADAPDNANQLWLPLRRTLVNNLASPSGLAAPPAGSDIGTTRLNVLSRHASWTDALPPAVDWSPYFGPAKDQGACGSCAVFAAVAAVEGAYGVWRGPPPAAVALAEAQVRDCSGVGSCLGGWPARVLDWLAAASGGLATATAYGPYSAQTEAACRAASVQRTVYVLRYEQVPASNVLALKAAVSRQPVTAFITLTQQLMVWNTWDIFTDSEGACEDDSQLSHALALVGYGSESGVAYWIVRNSFGPAWGRSGYARIKQGICGVTALPALYPVISPPDGNPCNVRINPCGRGTCIKSGNSYTCQCPSKYVAAQNTDNTQTCVLKDVCSATGVNPCGAGNCVNENNGYYHCVCFVGYVSAVNSDGRPLCVPPVQANPGLPQTYTVKAGDYCYLIAYAYGLTITQLKKQNTRANRDLCNPLWIGDVLNIQNAAAKTCKVLYSIQQDDSCWAIETAFGLAIGTLVKLNPGLICDVTSAPDGTPLGIQPGQQVCLVLGSPDNTKVCTSADVVLESDRGSKTCASILGRTPSLARFDFFEINRGINCGNLYAGQTVCTGFQVVPPAACRPYYQWQRGDTCSTVAQRFCGARSRPKWKKCMGQKTALCISSGQWAVGQVICVVRPTGCFLKTKRVPFCIG